jgi:uncharacterized membrane protein YphA (DoxX/SURF4 family)
MLVIDRGFVSAARIIVALTWFYQGLWLKVIARDPHHLEIVERVGLPHPLIALSVIGVCEGLLAIAVLSGFFPRAVAGFQIAVILSMNLTAILGSGGAIREPIGLLLGNAPLLLCIALVGWGRSVSARSA